MRDLKYYTCIYDSDEIELFFLEENGSCSFLMKEYRNNYDYFYEAIYPQQMHLRWLSIQQITTI